MLASILEKVLVAPAGQGRKFWVGDGMYTLIAEGDATNGQFAFVELNVTPGTGTPKHIHHKEDELFYVLDGEVTFWTGDEKTVAGPGAFVYIPKGAVHAWRNESATDVRFLNGITPAGFEQFFVAIGTPVSDEHPTPPAVGPEFGEKIARLAPTYNMEIVG